MTTWIDFSELRARVSLEDVLLKMYALGDRLKRQGDKLIGPCPIHNGDGPRAFHAELTKNCWFCFSGCKRGGNQIDFVALKEGITVREAALRLNAFFLGGASQTPPSSTTARAPLEAIPTAPTAPPSPPKIATGPPAAEKTDAPINPPLELRLTLDPTHPHLLKERALSLETVKAFGLGYAARGTLRGTIAIPIRDEDGDLVAYAGRRLKWADIKEHGRYKLPVGFRKDYVLYNLDRAKASAARDGLILVEGYFAVLKLFELGFANVVASMGSSLSEAQAQLLSEYANDVTILYDGNGAGRAGTEAARTLLASRGVRVHVVSLPHETAPDTVPPRTLRWALRGVKELDLVELRFSLQANPPTE